MSLRKNISNLTFGSVHSIYDCHAFAGNREVDNVDKESRGTRGNIVDPNGLVRGEGLRVARKDFTCDSTPADIYFPGLEQNADSSLSPRRLVNNRRVARGRPAPVISIFRA